MEINQIFPKPLFPSMLINVVNESMGLPAVTKQQEQKAKSFDFGGKVLLLAEDIPINRKIVRSYLNRTGIEIDEAENSVVALHKFIQNPERYDVILMDIHMPDMDGYEATRKIRRVDASSTKTVPIIAMTANVFKEDIDRCLHVGMDNHIGKPVKMVDLQNTLAIYLSHPLDTESPSDEPTGKIP